MKLSFISLLFITFHILTSCYFFENNDTSSSVDSRFNDKDNLKNYPSPNIADTNNFSLVVISDTHYKDSQPGYFNYIEQNKVNWGVSFIVIDGDITDNGTQKAYNFAKDDMSSTMLQIYPVVGNHDLYNNGFDIYKNAFGRTIYDIKVGNTLHMIFIDTANGTLGEKQKKWLTDILSNSNCKNKIVFSHYSPTDKEWESPTSITYPEDAYFLFDTLSKYNVNYCISGHLHYYDCKESRGVKYIIVNNRSKNDKSHVKITISNGNISDSAF